MSGPPIPPEILDILKSVVKKYGVNILTKFIRWLSSERIAENLPPEIVIKLMEPYIDDEEIITKLKNLIEAYKLGLIKRSVILEIAEASEARSDPDIKGKIDTLKNFMARSDWLCLRLCYASYMAERKGKYKRALSIKGKIIERYGERGRKMWNLVISNEIEYVMDIAVQCMFDYILNVSKMKECFQQKFDELLEYYEKAIFVSDIRPDEIEIMQGIIDRFSKVDKIVIYGRGREAISKIDKAVSNAEAYLKDKYNIEINVVKREEKELLKEPSIVIHLKKD